MHIDARAVIVCHGAPNSLVRLGNRFLQRFGLVDLMTRPNERFESVHDPVRHHLHTGKCLDASAVDEKPDPVWHIQGRKILATIESRARISVADSSKQQRVLRQIDGAVVCGDSEANTSTRRDENSNFSHQDTGVTRPQTRNSVGNPNTDQTPKCSTRENRADTANPSCRLKQPKFAAQKHISGGKEVEKLQARRRTWRA